MRELRPAAGVGPDWPGVRSSSATAANSASDSGILLSKAIDDGAGSVDQSPAAESSRAPIIHWAPADAAITTTCDHGRIIARPWPPDGTTGSAD